jgi:dipeptidyl aminopeptidase/acylaminoacyl peptidase
MQNAFGALPHHRTRATLSLALPLSILLTGCAGSVHTDESSRPAASAGYTAPIPLPGSYTIEQMLAIPSLSGLEFSPDGTKLLTSSTFSGVMNPMFLDVASRSLSSIHSSNDVLTGVAFVGRGGNVLLQGSTGGNEQDQLYLRAPSGELTNITPDDSHVERFLTLTADRSGFYYATNQRDPTRFDIFRYDPAARSSAPVYINDNGRELSRISDDGRYVVTADQPDNRSERLYLTDVRAGRTTLLTAPQGVSERAYAFTPDGRQLLLTTDLGADFQRLQRYDLRTGVRHDLYREKWDVRDVKLAAGGKLLLLSVNRDARWELEAFSFPELRPLPLPRLQAVSAFAATPDGKRIAVRMTGGSAPADIYMFDVGRTELTRLTEILPRSINASDLVEPERLTFPSYDGVAIQGLFFRPKGGDRKRPPGAVMFINGGPGAQNEIGFSARVQYVVNQGHAVFMVNHRGTEGRGKAYYHLDDGKHGDADLRDVVFAKRHLAGLGLIDGDRVAVLGASYGGFMTVRALTDFPEEFAGGVDIYGVMNWERTLANMPSWWGQSARNYYAAEMGSDPTYLRSISPLSKVDRIVKPLVVVQGANDPRVLQRESDDMVVALKARGVPVDYILFPDEGHSIAKRANQITAWRAIGDFLHRIIGNPAGAPADR